MRKYLTCSRFGPTATINRRFCPSALTPRIPLRRIRCHYPSAETFIQALDNPGESNSLRIFTTERFDPGEELLAEIFFPDLPGKMMIRAIGMEWHSARPRLRVRAGGSLRCTGSEWRKLEFLREVAAGNQTINQRRRHVRQPILVEVAWRRQRERDTIRATITEISEAGALLLLAGNFPEIGEEIIIEITPPGSQRALEVQSVVRNHNHNDGVGVEFLARDMGGVQRIREVIRRIIEDES